MPNDPTNITNLQPVKTPAKSPKFSFRFVAGFLALWFILLAMIEFGLYQLAAYIAALIVFSMFMLWGDKVFISLNTILKG